MSKVIVTSEAELESIIQNSVRKVLAENAGQSKTPNSDRFLTVKEAAELLSLAPATIYQRTSAGTIPFVKRGKKLYFSSDALKEWILNGTGNGK